MAESDLDLVNPDLLPPLMRNLVRLIGLPETLRLLEARGGIPTYIPAHPDQSTELKAVLSAAALEALARSEYAGHRVELPKPDKVIAQLRNHAIRNARTQMSAAQVARTFGLTRRHVINLSASDAEDPTLDLFTACDSAASGSH